MKDKPSFIPSVFSLVIDTAEFFFLTNLIVDAFNFYQTISHKNI
jgi:hypothetical protein